MTIPQGIKRVICLLLSACFFFQNTLTCYGQALIPTLTPQALNFNPPTLKYLSVNSANPYNYFNFLLDKGSKPALANSGAGLEQEARKLIHYFFIGLTLPESALWVNLRPDEPGRITSLELAQTDMGKLLLEQDLRLKKDVAQYLNPKHPTGKKFWEELYSQAELLLGKGKLKKTAITTSNRVWIVPDEAVVMETEDGALVTQAKLKVLLESEYLSLKAKSWNKEVEVQIQNKDQLKNLAEALMKSIIIPEISKEVNSGKNYAPLRQIYHSLILAQWFKRKNSRTHEPTNPYVQAIDQGWLKGLESEFPWSKDAIWQEYLASFQKGEYQLKEKLAGLNRMYTSGGILLGVEHIRIEPPGGGVSSPIEAGNDESMLIVTQGKGSNSLLPEKITPIYSTIHNDDQGQLREYNPPSLEREIPSSAPSPLAEQAALEMKKQQRIRLDILQDESRTLVERQKALEFFAGANRIIADIGLELITSLIEIDSNVHSPKQFREFASWLSRRLYKKFNSQEKKNIQRKALDILQDESRTPGERQKALGFLSFVMAAWHYGDIIIDDIIIYVGGILVAIIKNEDNSAGFRNEALSLLGGYENTFLPDKRARLSLYDLVPSLTSIMRNEPLGSWAQKTASRLFLLLMWEFPQTHYEIVKTHAAPHLEKILLNLAESYPQQLKNQGRLQEGYEVIRDVIQILYAAGEMSLARNLMEGRIALSNPENLPEFNKIMISALASGGAYDFLISIIKDSNLAIYLRQEALKRLSVDLHRKEIFRKETWEELIKNLKSLIPAMQDIIADPKSTDEFRQLSMETLSALGSHEKAIASRLEALKAIALNAAVNPRDRITSIIDLAQEGELESVKEVPLEKAALITGKSLVSLGSAELLRSILEALNAKIAIRVYEQASISAAKTFIGALGLGLEHVVIIPVIREGHEQEESGKLVKVRYEVTSDRVRAIFSGFEQQPDGVNPLVAMEFHDQPSIQPLDGSDVILELPYIPFKLGLPEPISDSEKNSARDALGIGNRKVIVAGSPSNLEFQRIIAAYKELYGNLQIAERPLLIVGFRHPKSKDEFKEALSEQSVEVRDYASKPLPDLSGHNMLFLNTAGELLKFYAIADVAIIGHDRNLFEPASQGVATLTFEGAWSNNKEPVEALTEANSMQYFSRDALENLVNNLELQRVMGKNAQRVVRDYQQRVRAEAENSALLMSIMLSMLHSSSSAIQEDKGLDVSLPGEHTSAASPLAEQDEPVLSPVEQEHKDDSSEVRERQEARGKLNDLLRTSNRVDINVIKQMDANGSLYEAIPELRALLVESNDPGHTAKRRIDHVFDALEFFEGLSGNMLNTASDDQANKIKEDLAIIRERIGQDPNDLYLLRLAILLHDIGKRTEKKPLEASHDEHGAADMLPLILGRIEGLTVEDKDNISYLVAHHSVLSFFSQKRDIANPDFVVEAVDVLGEDLKRIKMLYLLSIADFVAVDTENNGNNSVWILSLAKTFEAISAELSKEGSLEKAREKLKKGYFEENYREHREEIKKLYFGLMGLPFIAGAEPARLQRHLSLFEGVLRGKAKVTLSKLTYYDWTQYKELVVGVPEDRPGLLRIITGFLAERGYDIHLAGIDTVEIYGKKVIFDRFLIKRASGQNDDGLEQEMVSEINSFIDSGKINLDMDVIKQKLPELTNSEVKIDFEKSEDGKIKQMTIKTKDIMGLLFRIADVLSESRINLRKAIIKTWGSDVGNVFFIEDENGNPLEEKTANELRVKLERELTASSPLNDEVRDIGSVKTLDDLARFIVLREKTKSLTSYIMQLAYVKYVELTEKGPQRFELKDKVEVLKRFLKTVKQIENKELAGVSIKDRPSHWLGVESRLLGMGDISKLDGEEFRGDPVVNAARLESERLRSKQERIKLTIWQKELEDAVRQFISTKSSPERIIETIKKINGFKLDISNVPPKVFTFTNEAKQDLVKHMESGGNDLVSRIAYFIHRRDSLIDKMGFPVTDENREIFIADLNEIIKWKKTSLPQVEVYSHSDLVDVFLEDLIEQLEKGNVARVDILSPSLSDIIRIEFVRREDKAASSSARSSSPLETKVGLDKSRATEYGGIDLSRIEVTLQDEKFVSQLNPADLKVLRAAKYLKEGWGSLSLLYVHEIMFLLKDNLANDIKQKGLLQEVLKQLQVKGFAVPEIRLAAAG